MLLTVHSSALTARRTWLSASRQAERVLTISSHFCAAQRNRSSPDFTHGFRASRFDGPARLPSTTIFAKRALHRRATLSEKCCRSPRCCSSLRSAPLLLRCSPCWLEQCRSRSRLAERCCSPTSGRCRCSCRTSSQCSGSAWESTTPCSWWDDSAKACWKGCRAATQQRKRSGRGTHDRALRGVGRDRFLGPADRSGQ